MEALQFRDLKKVYGNGVVALRGITLSVEQGDFFGLLGPNGAGKSTAIGIVTSLVTKTAGEVFVFEHSIDNALVKAKSCIGLVPQEFNFNIFERVIDILVTQAGYYGLPFKLATERAEKYLKKLGIWEKRDARARMLSGGMKRRLMIARALIHEPKLLILDEPTAGVDIELRRRMWDFLQEINAEGTTVILTTHYLEEAEHLCRNIAIIDQGEIIEHSSKKALLEKLHSETIILDLASPVSEAPVVSCFDITLIDTTTLEIQFAKTCILNDLFGGLSEQGIEVRSLRNKANRLEELFISLVQKTDN